MGKFLADYRFHWRALTRVRWGFKGTIKYPLNAILIFVNLQKVLGEQLSAGLLNAKNWLESTK